MSLTRIVPRWLPALAMMGIIFWFSSQPSDELLSFGLWDWVVKKTGHVVGYGLLALSFWFGFEFRHEKRWAAWCFAVIYAVTDEFHQSFVPGRHPSVWDVLIFDNLGALVFLLLTSEYLKQKRPAADADR